MFKTALLSGLKSISSPFSVNSLYNTSKFFKSKVKKSRKEIIERLERDPRFKRIAKMKIPDLKDPNITFPINIPIQYRYVYRPSKNPPKLRHHDYIDFTKMTGNEILLNLENCKHLRPSEFSSALFELSIKPGSANVDWNEHDWIKDCVSDAIKRLSQFDARSVATVAYAFHNLGIKEPLLWSTLERESNKTIQKLKARGFAITYVSFLSAPDRCSNEYKQKLAASLPIFIRKMNPDMIVRCFELTQKQGLMTEYLFDHHFFMLIWKRLHWFGANNYAKILRIFTEMNFNEDLEFWSEDFLPSFKKILEQADENQCKGLLEALTAAKAKIPDLEIDETVDLINKRIAYINTKLKAIENTKFWNVVSNDIQYYREKEKLRILKERGLQA